jgi:two-component system, sensor histidine kinase
LIATSTAAALIFDDAKSARENLASLKARPGIRAAAIYTSGGTRMASYGATTEEETAESAASIPALGARFTGSTIEVVYPIQRDGERVGTLYLRAHHNIWSRLLGYAVILGAISLGSLGLAFYVFDTLQSRVTVPLARITDVARQVMSSRDWALRAPETDYQDVAVLVEAFNGVLTECGNRTSELELQDRRKDEFLATLAHELRNPLAPMTTAVALLDLAAASPAQKANATAILGRQLRHMVRLIDDLLDASRIATGKLSLTTRPVDVVELLRSCAELAETDASRKGIALRVSLPALPICVDGDSIRLAQVFSNLLHNACKYTGSSGSIAISATSDGAMVEVVVDDTGIGIEASAQTRIFELFEQVDKSLERGSAGLGIGLTLARQLVLMHGGEIAVSSDGLGRGSRFVVRLPALERTDASEPPRALVNAPRRLRILIADDNVDQAESLAVVLRTQGHVVQVVHDGNAAVKAACEHAPEVALLDIGMPHNGYLVARELRGKASTRGIRLVAITGWSVGQDQEATEGTAFDRRLLKPLQPDKLFSTLAELFPSHEDSSESVA